MSDRKCAACGATIPPAPRGRPRRYCTSCVPPGTGKAATAAWRALNPERMAAYNAARRASHPPRPCAGCGMTFDPPRADSRHCCARCRSRCRALGEPLPPFAAFEHRARYHGATVEPWSPPEGER